MKSAVSVLESGSAEARTEALAKLDSWWVQFGDHVLLYAAENKWGRVKSQARLGGVHLRGGHTDVKKGDMYLVVQKGRLFQQQYPDVRVLLDKGRYLAVEMLPSQLADFEPHEACFSVQPLRENSVVFEEIAPPTRTEAAGPLQSIVDSVSLSRMEATLAQLVSYRTRFSTSVEYVDAVEWIGHQLDSLAYEVRFQELTVGVGRSYNVIAQKKEEAIGSESDRKLVIICAHLDTINKNGDFSSPAPGADDNATGCAAVLEMATLFKDLTFEHDVRFVLFGAEEQGMIGSQHYVDMLAEEDHYRVAAVINLDMIGTRNTSNPTVLIEGSSVSRTVINGLEEAALTYTNLTVQRSLNPFASDHVPFIDASLPAVLTIEGSDNANTNIHTGNDSLAYIDLDLMREIVKMNVAFVAKQLGVSGRQSGMATSGQLPDWVAPLRPIFSGRYLYNGGASDLVAISEVELQDAQTPAALRDPTIVLNQPIYTVDHTSWRDWWNTLRFTLHIDIDGPNPLGVVSGMVTKEIAFPWFGSVSSDALPFVGRVETNQIEGNVRKLGVDQFEFRWPRSQQIVDRIEIELAGSNQTKPTARVTFIASGTNKSFGPYTVAQTSPYFRTVELEIDQEDGVSAIEPYDTLLHPDRPADLPQENLTLETAFAKSGIEVIRSDESNVIDTSEAGANGRWSEQELHDAMESHWSAFANRPQWKMWVFVAGLADDDALGGIMFDGDIDEAGGVDRQGAAVFTKAPVFHTVDGAYVQANPPFEEAIRRELFFNLIHETGHAFNLAHSFQKTMGTPWDAPEWMPVKSDAQALSWMNYPDAASPSTGLNAEWFYNRFRFRFDDNDNLFLRHAPSKLVRMGDKPWFQSHGRVSRSSLDRRLELVVRGLKKTVELGEPVMLELRLCNVSGEPVVVHRNLSLRDGFIEIAVTKPDGTRQPFIPITHARALVQTEVLEPGHRIYQPINITMGHLGFPFKEPGAYRIEVSYHNVDGSTAAALMQLWVNRPQIDDFPVISELFNARVGRVLMMGGSRIMQDVNDKLMWVSDRLDDKHPLQFHLAATLAVPVADQFKVLEAHSTKVELLDADPGMAHQRLACAVENANVEAAADTMGHIEYQRVVDTYSRVATATRKRAQARRAQEKMHDLFEQREVVQSVVDEIENKIETMK